MKLKLFPEQNSGVVALCNLRGPQSHAIGTAVARLVFGSAGGSGDDFVEQHDAE